MATRRPRQASLSVDDWRVAAATVVLVPITAALIRLVSLDKASSMAGRIPSIGTGVLARMPAPRLSAVVDAVALRLHAPCLTRAIVLQALLARSGVASEVVVGIARSGRALRAHAWVERHGTVVSAAGPDGCAVLHRMVAAPRAKEMTG